MQWENCIRCGSNRVVKRSSAGLGIILIIFGFLSKDFFEVAGVGESAKFISLGLIILGVFIFFFSGKLYCKDCELIWKPIKKD